MNGSPTRDQQGDIRKRMFCCLEMSIPSSLHARKSPRMEYTHHHFTWNMKGIDGGKSNLLWAQWEGRTRLPMKKCVGDGNNQDTSNYSVCPNNSHFLFPTHLIFFFCNQTMTCSCSARAFFFIPSYIYMGSSVCNSRVPTHSSEPSSNSISNPALLDLLEIINYFIPLPSASTLPFRNFYCATRITILGSRVSPTRLTHEDSIFIIRIALTYENRVWSSYGIK